MKNSFSATGLNRREFISKTSVALAAAAFPSIIPSSALGKDGAVAPGSRITLGVIGCGPQGRGDMGSFLNQKDCQVVAVCDVKKDQLDIARAAVNEHYQNQDCRTHKDFRELVASKDIDACLIATPDHWHVLTALAAVNAGKDVYLEKPLAVSLEEGQVLREAVQKRNRVFQFGTQQRSSRVFRQAGELVFNNALGRLRHINVWAPGSAPGGSREVAPVPEGLDYDLWLGPAAFEDYTENRCSAENTKKTWWFISDYTLGFISGWGIHPMDIALWGAGDLMADKVTVEGRGNFRYAEGVCDTATIWEVDYKFDSGLTVKFVGVPNAHNENGPTGEPFLHEEEWKQRYGKLSRHGTAFEGADGWLEVHRGGMNVQPQSLMDINGDELKVKFTNSTGQTRNFLDCVKSRGETVSPIESAVKADIMCHIADIAMRLQRKLTFDMKGERFLGDDAANRRLRARLMRRPWKLRA